MSRPIRIVVADDDLAILDLYRTVFGLPNDQDEIHDTLNDILTLLGGDREKQSEPKFPVVLHSQGLDAVREARAATERGEPFSHALLDMRMPPGIDGLEVARYLRENDPEIEIIFVSAYTDYEDEQIRKVLPEGYRMIRKPFTDQQILQLFEPE